MVLNAKSHTRQLWLYCTGDNLAPMFVWYIEVYVLDKTWCEYELYQITDYDVNP